MPMTSGLWALCMFARRQDDGYGWEPGQEEKVTVSGTLPSGSRAMEPSGVIGTLLNVWQENPVRLGITETIPATTHCA
jgi:hypothetical protein